MRHLFLARRVGPLDPEPCRKCQTAGADRLTSIPKERSKSADANSRISLNRKASYAEVSLITIWPALVHSWRHDGRWFKNTRKHLTLSFYFDTHVARAYLCRIIRRGTNGIQHCNWALAKEAAMKSDGIETDQQFLYIQHYHRLFIMHASRVSKSLCQV